MNPWQFLRREIDGAVRSVRYDLVRRRARRAMNAKTTEIPTLTANRPSRKRRMILASSSALMAAGSIGGYFAVTSGLDALVAGGGSPAGLPDAGPPAPQTTPTAQIEVTPSAGAYQPVPVSNNTGLPTAPIPEATVPNTPTGSPPVPTPAPTCGCPTPSPTVSPTPEPTPTPSTPPSTSAATP